MLSSAANATSTTEVTCLSPSWGSLYRAINTTVELLEDTSKNGSGLVDLYSDYYLGDEYSDYRFEYSDFDPTYEMYQAFAGVSPINGSAAGKENITVDAYGLIAKQDTYFCRFTAVSDSSDVMDSIAAMATSETGLTCRTPQWGESYAGQDTKVEVFSVPGVEVRAVIDNDYEFVEDWVLADTDNDYGAIGGDDVVITGAGFSTDNGYYKCRFEDRTTGDHVSSTKASVASLTELTCVTPAWGDYYEATNATLVLVHHASAADHVVVGKRRGAVEDLFNFYDAWSSSWA